MKNNKIIIIICVIIIILSGIVVYFKTNYYKTEEAMFELTQNINNYSNLHVHTIETSDQYGILEIDRYWKDNEFNEKNSINNQNDYVYINSDEKVYINVSEKDKKIYIQENDDANSRNIIYKSENFTGIFVVDINNINQDYKYCGVENINNKECYKIFVKNKSQNDETTLWIEKKTGFVLKQKSLFDGELVTFENTYEIGNVTDVDIKKPNMQFYRDNGEYEIINK